MKIHGHGQATPINEFFYKKIRKNMITPAHQLILDFGYYTGERWGAILQLRVEDVYLDPVRRVVREDVTFRKATRKDRETRQVPIHPELNLRLRSYKCEFEGWLFPSLVKPGCHLSSRAADRALRRAIARAGLEDAGFSTHSTRRGFITDLYDKFKDVKLIQSLTGHKSLAVVSRYIEVSEERRRQAIALR